MTTPGTLPRGTSASIGARLGVALVVTLLSLLIAKTLLASGLAPYFTAFATVAICTRFCGTGTAVASLALSSLAIDYWFIPPTNSLRIMDTADLVNFFAFLSAAFVVVAIGESNLRERGRLRNAAGALEEKVQERTFELDHANQSLRQLTGQLLNLQDEERRRIARELHDNAGQALSVLSMNLGAVAEDLGRMIKTAATVTDSASMVRQMSDDIRTMSYLLHPPLLDEMGLVPALQWYVKGFAERSKIAVNLECAKDFGRLAGDVETAIFRIVQECLINIHRHSGSPTASIQIICSDGCVRLEVTDNGKGISPDLCHQMESGGTLGVGIRGMRERASQLGGSLEISSDGVGTGTRIVVRLPATDVFPVVINEPWP